MSGGSWNIIKALTDLLPTDLTNKRMLDIGFGCGQVTHVLLSNSGRYAVPYHGMPYVLGIDIDQSNIDFAKKYMPYYKELLVRDATDIPYPPAFTKDLNIVICTQMVEHIENKKKTIEMIKYVWNLAPLVIFTTMDGDTRKTIETHKSVWYKKDFTKLGFETKLNTIYPSSVLPILDFLSYLRRGKRITRNIIAWKQNF